MPERHNLEDWRILCELVLRVEDPAKFNDLVERLIKALDQYRQRRDDEVPDSRVDYRRISQ